MSNDLFDEELELPNRDAQRRLDELVGLDEVKANLVANATVLLDPVALKDWSLKEHGQVLSVVESFARRTPLVVLAGDVGTGKTSLAENFAHVVATERNINISVLRLSLRSRGSGAVGEMTRLIGDAFDEVISRGRKLPDGDALVVIIDEADAIAQSRELSQMHHEDRAGVNALIRGIDAVGAEAMPVLVVMCTNRLQALDPAVRRRAAAEFEFVRPSDEQRRQFLTAALEGCPLDPDDIDRLVDLTGECERGFGHTYSDLANRVLPAAVLMAFPDQPINRTHLIGAIAAHPPTPPFRSE